MDDSAIRQLLLTTTFTKQQLTARMRLLRSYAELVSFTSLQSSLTEYLSLQNVPLEEQKIIAHWYDLAVKLAAGKPLINAVKQIENALENVPSLTLYLPKASENTSVSTSCLWFRKQLNPEIVLEVSVKPELVAGMAFVWNGKYRDFSLHYFFEKHKAEIKQVIDEYTVS